MNTEIKFSLKEHLADDIITVDGLEVGRIVKTFVPNEHLHALYDIDQDHRNAVKKPWQV